MTHFVTTRVLLKKLEDAFVSVLPVTLLVLLLQLTPWSSLPGRDILLFLCCAVALVFGIALFNLGADLAMTPMGEQIGSGLSKLRSWPLLLGVSFAMGVLITVAEPDLSVLASQVSDIIAEKTLMITVGCGVGLFLVLAILKILFKTSLSPVLLFFYMLLFACTALLAVRGNTPLLPLSLDSGGVTTGPVTVPFLMALGVGIAQTMGGRNVGENSFGLIAMCSIGPILAVMLLGLSATGEITYVLPDYTVPSALGAAIFRTLLDTAKEVALALGLIVFFFLLLQVFFLHLPAKKLLRIGIGIVYTFAGLVIFLSAANVGFLPIGFALGGQLAAQPAAVVVLFGLIIGAVVVLAEPAVHVLNLQVEEITNGSVTRKQMTVALSCGVGLSIALSLVRILCGFSILYYVIPGYLLSLGLSFFVPGVYTAIAFDSGGVASGPLTSTFILPFAIGVCTAAQGVDGILEYAFGVVAMVAMTPLITIQMLGFRSVVQKELRKKITMRRILNADDEQIITF